MKWLVVKGIAGLGDRLGTLMNAIRYAKLTGRTLVIDWSDLSWNHDVPAKGFWHYMDLHDLPCDVVRGDAQTAALLTTLDANGVSVFPPVFRGKLTRSDYWFSHERRRVELDGEPVGTRFDMLVGSDADVIVHVGYSATRQDALVPHLSIRWDGPPLEEYDIGIHFRNTDKNGDLLGAMREATALWSPGKSVYLATDDVHVVKVFRSRFGDDLTVTQPPPRAAWGGGIHHVFADDLAAAGLTKERLNWDMFRDILILVRARAFVPCRVSAFSWLVEALRSDLKGRLSE